MPIRSRRKVASRRRETVFPESENSRSELFVNNDRQRRQKGRVVEQLVDSPSVIMLSSAENTPGPLVGHPGIRDGSVVDISSVPGRATRLTDVDMVLEETDMRSHRARTQLFALDETNTSVVNLDETEMIIRDRPKSSVAQRWTRSASLAPVDIVGEARRSSVYSMVTKRNRRGAAGARVAMSGASIVPEDREANDGAGKDLSQITEEQSTSPGSSGSERTPQPVVRELVIQTRTMLRQGKKWSPEKGRAKSASRATSLESKVSRRKRKDPNPLPEQPIEHVSAQKKPESSDSTEIASRKSSQFSKVSKRKRPKHAPDKSKEATSEISEPDRSSELSGSRSVSQVREPRSKKRRTEPNKGVSETNNNETLKDLSSSDNQDTASTSRRPRTRSVSRPRQTPASLPKRGRSRTRTTQKEPSSSENSDPDTTSKRIQTRSASRARKPEQTDTGKRGRQRPRARAASESVEQATEAQTQPSQAPSSQKQRGRPRKRTTPDDSVTQKSTKEPSDTDKPASQSDSISKRPRTRSVSRARQLPSDSKSSTVRKRQNKSSSSTSVQPNKPSTSSRSSRIRTKSPAPLERSSTRSTPTRAKSVPRNVLLSPPPSTASKSLQHIPIYRRYAEQVLQLTSRPKTPKPKPTAPTGESDIYSFDSLSQSSSGGSDDNAGAGKGTVKASKGGSTVKKRANNVSRNSKKTPLKKTQHHQHPTVFGTDMYKISSVVKKIGGGPVRRRQEDPVGSETTASEVASRNVVPTSTLAALVQSQQPSNAPLVNPRSPSPAIANDDDHHHDDPDENHGFEIENIPDVEMPTPLSPPRLNPQIHRIMQQKITAPQVHTPDKTQPNATLNFSPLGASSPWRVQNENILPKTFYFARSADLLPSYESDLVIQDENRPQAKPRDEAPAPPVPVLPPTTASPRPTNIPPTNHSKPSAAVFSDIQRSYEQLKATSEMSEKLIAAMRKYKSNVHNQTTSMGNESSPEELFAKFREYEENMKKTYLKLKQWYDRSKRSYTQTMQAIEQAAPKTQAQQQLVENFRRNSQRFVTMMTDLESAMNDSNLENLSPPKSVENRTKPAFKDVILTERNLNDRNRSPLKTLNIVNLPPRFSPIKSPLVKASFASFTANRTLPQHSKSRDLFSRLSLTKPTRTEISNAAPVESVIEVADTMVEDPQPELENTKHDQPQKDLFGFESDCEEEDQDDATHVSVNPTPVKITRETLKERLQSVRKLLPQPNRSMIGEGSSSFQQQSMPRIFNSPQRRQKRLHTIQSVFSSSTPLGEKRNRWAKMGRREPVAETAAAEEPNVSAIETAEKATSETRAQQESPPAAVFDEPEQELASASINNSANRTYGRAPRRNVKRKRNIYLANLGLSDSEEEEEEEEQNIAPEDKADPEWTEADSDTDWANAGKHRKKRQQTKKQKTHNQPDAAAGKKKKQKKTVEQTAEFQNFVSEFNNMCEQVNKYQLVIEKPAAVPQQV
nr:proteoglycan 4-like [Aedes albopictus]